MDHVLSWYDVEEEEEEEEERWATVLLL